jgi:3-methyladenine DNA glycosylase Mpg
LAAYFVEGYAEALQNSTTTTTTDGNTVTETEAIEDNTDRAIAALGNVGTKLAPEIEAGFDTPVTVYVYRGTGIGILFVSGISVENN